MKVVVFDNHWPVVLPMSLEYTTNMKIIMMFEGCSVYYNTSLSKVIRHLVKIMSVRACIWCHWCCRRLLCTFQSWQLFHFSKLNWLYGREPFLGSQQVFGKSLNFPRMLWKPNLRCCNHKILHWSVFWARWIQSTPSHPISSTFILIILLHPLVHYLTH